MRLQDEKKTNLVNYNGNWTYQTGFFIKHFLIT